MSMPQALLLLTLSWLSMNDLVANVTQTCKAARELIAKQSHPSLWRNSVFYCDYRNIKIGPEMSSRVNHLVLATGIQLADVKSFVGPIHSLTTHIYDTYVGRALFGSKNAFFTDESFYQFVVSHSGDIPKINSLRFDCGAPGGIVCFHDIYAMFTSAVLCQARELVLDLRRVRVFMSSMHQPDITNAFLYVIAFLVRENKTVHLRKLHFLMPHLHCPMFFDRSWEQELHKLPKERFDVVVM